MAHKLQQKIEKFLRNLNMSSSIIKATSTYKNVVCTGERCVYVETATFNAEKEKGLKLYLYGTFDFSSSQISKYNTKVVLSQKKGSQEIVLHSMHFDGDLGETKYDHPIFHMQFDKKIIRRILPDKDENYFVYDHIQESKSLRIPTPQMDVFTFVYYYFQAIDYANVINRPKNYNENMQEILGIKSIQHGCLDNIPCTFFP